MRGLRKEHILMVSFTSVQVHKYTCAIVTIVLLSVVPTGVPQNLTIVAINSSSVKVSWEPPQADLRNGIIVDNIVRITGVDTEEMFVLNTGEDTGVIVVTNLHPFYTYTYSIASVTIGIGPFSPAVPFQMPQEGM